MMLIIIPGTVNIFIKCNDSDSRPMSIGKEDWKVKAKPPRTIAIPGITTSI